MLFEVIDEYCYDPRLNLDLLIIIISLKGKVNHLYNFICHNTLG